MPSRAAVIAAYVTPPPRRQPRESVASMSRVAAPTTTMGGRLATPILGSMYFYELSESDDEILANVLLGHDSEYDEQEFLELVLEARESVMASFEEESLIEAVATELEKKHGFVQVEANLRAAVRVSAEEDETVIVAVDERVAAAAIGEEEDFRTMLIETEIEDRPYRDN